MKTVEIGNFRYVFVLRFGGIVVKIPRLDTLSAGMRCNRWEREMWRTWRPRFAWTSLCPVWLADPCGFMVLMPYACDPVTPDEAVMADDAERVPTTAEGKPDDYRRLHGRVVAIDYGLASDAAVHERRAYYRELREAGRR